MNVRVKTTLSFQFDEDVSSEAWQGMFPLVLTSSSLLEFLSISFLSLCVLYLQCRWKLSCHHSLRRKNYKLSSLLISSSAHERPYTSDGYLSWWLLSHSFPVTTHKKSDFGQLNIWIHLTGDRRSLIPSTRYCERNTVSLVLPSFDKNLKKGSLLFQAAFPFIFKMIKCHIAPSD
jgi:hypothetical protein